MIDQSILYIPSLDMNVVISFFKDPMKFKIDYVPTSLYNETTIKNEVKKIIIEMLKEIEKEIE